MNRAIADRIRGMMFGQALGDAVGLQTEFKFKEDRSDDGPIVFPRTEIIRGWQPNDFTDDTDHLVLLARSIREVIDVADLPMSFARNLHKWSTCGFPELGDTCGLGIGGTMMTLLADSNFESDPIAVSRQVWQTSGCRLAANGSLMRTSVLGTMPQLLPNTVVQVCRTTHYDLRCVGACIIQTYMVRSLIYRKSRVDMDIDRSLQMILRDLKSILNAANSQSDSTTENISRNATPQSYAVEDNYAAIIEAVKLGYSGNLAKLYLGGIADRGTIGYVLKCLSCSMYALRRLRDHTKVAQFNLFRQVITDIANECGDADTNCAVAGAMLGAAIGYSALPDDWLAGLANSEWLHNETDELIAHIAKKGI